MRVCFGFANARAKVKQIGKRLTTKADLPAVFINYKTFAETEPLVHIAIEIPGRSNKDITAATAINPNTLYKRKSSSNHMTNRINARSGTAS